MQKKTALFERKTRGNKFFSQTGGSEGLLLSNEGETLKSLSLKKQKSRYNKVPSIYYNDAQFKFQPTMLEHSNYEILVPVTKTIIKDKRIRFKSDHQLALEDSSDSDNERNLEMVEEDSDGSLYTEESVEDL